MGALLHPEREARYDGLLTNGNSRSALIGRCRMRYTRERGSLIMTAFDMRDCVTHVYSKNYDSRQETG